MDTMRQEMEQLKEEIARREAELEAYAAALRSSRIVRPTRLATILSSIRWYLAAVVGAFTPQQQQHQGCIVSIPPRRHRSLAWWRRVSRREAHEG